MPVINHWGTFELANYGDLLFPLILEQVLGKVCPSGLRVNLYGPAGGRFLPDPSRRVNRIQRIEEPGFLEQAADCDAIVLGGGDIIRTDDAAMARVYSCTREEAETGRFSRVFLKDLGKLTARCPVLWNAVGVPHEFAAHECAEVREALEPVTYLSVRDHTSRERLVRAGVERDIHVVPDSAFLLPRLFPADQLRAAIDDLREKFQFPETGRVLSLQLSFVSRATEEVVAKALDSLLNKYPDLNVALIPTGPCHGDFERLTRILGLLRTRQFILNGPMSLLDITAAIAYSDYFAGSSLHGNIAAFCYGVESVILSLPPYSASKLGAYSELLNRKVVTHDESLLARLDQLVDNKYPIRGNTYAHIEKQLDAHFARIAAHISQDALGLEPMASAL